MTDRQTTSYSGYYKTKQLLFKICTYAWILNKAYKLKLGILCIYSRLNKGKVAKFNVH